MTSMQFMNQRFTMLYQLIASISSVGVTFAVLCRWLRNTFPNSDMNTMTAPSIPNMPIECPYIRHESRMDKPEIYTSDLILAVSQ